MCVSGSLLRCRREDNQVSNGRQLLLLRRRSIFAAATGGYRDARYREIKPVDNMPILEIFGRGRYTGVFCEATTNVSHG